jgi:uncharacterized membrane protein YraQ (UPF0718 family)
MLDAFADWLIYGLAGLSDTTYLGEAVHFFLYETLKIGLLLVVVTHLMGLINAYLTVERVREWIASRRLRGSEHLVASGEMVEVIIEDLSEQIEEDRWMLRAWLNDL